MLRIAIIMTFPAPYRIPLLNEIAALLGVELTVLVTEPRAVEKRNEREKFQFRYELIATHVIHSQNRFGDRVGFVISPALVSCLWQGKYDALVCLGWTMPNTMVARLVGALRGIPVILWDESIPHSPNPLKKIMLPALRRYFDSFQGYLAASSWCRDYMIEMGAAAERVVIFPQVADNAFFQSENAWLRPQRDALKRALGITTARVILFVGQLIPRKGVLDLMDAFEIIAAGDAEVSLVMVGEGVLRAELQTRRAASRYANRIFIQPFASQQELPTYYALADIFVLPSLYDTFGVVVNEAMASGLPVVTTHNVGATADLVADGVNGRIVPPGDAHALARALRELLQDEPLRAMMGKQSLERIGQWTIPMAGRRFMECLTRVMDGSGKWNADECISPLS